MQPLTLDRTEVCVWWAALDPPSDRLPERLALLSDDEVARANCYVFERHRLRYIAGRAYLRSLLGAALGLEPAQIEFEYSPLGKPALKKTYDGPELHFNLSNSENRAVVALSWGRSVGVDLELIRPMPDEDDFARQFFCSSEVALLRSLSGWAKRKTFFELWTSKEALLKAMGDGLTRSINEVEVALQSGASRLVSIAGDPRPAAGWQLSLFQPAPGYQAALAVAGQGIRPRFYQAEGDFYPK